MNISTTYLADYQPYPFSVKAVHLEFDLYNDYALVTNTMQIVRNSFGDLYLNGEALKLISIHLNDRALLEHEYQLSPESLTIFNCPEAFELSIKTQIYPQKNTELSGLYRSNHLFCTQCEAEGFRRITFFPDRPDVLTIYTTKIIADQAQYPVLLSNGNLQETGKNLNGRHWSIWHDPFKKPSYLFALVAGNLACVEDQYTTCSGRNVVLRLYVEPGNEDKCTHALQSLKKSMRWDEEKFGREYDLSIFMIVAVSDFNMGAMENKGLNIFNAKYILARPDTATDHDYAGIESVVAHEYFHNWTGNRITCRDWFQLSLKEGLTVYRDQEFSRDMNSREVNRILDVKQLRNTQFPEDAGKMAHPVRPSSYQEINNFYTATIYDKGAEVIRMQQTLLGTKGFRQGMDLYFERHDGQAVTIDDFVAAMEDANQVDLSQFKRWYDQAGTPEIHVQSHFEHGTLSLTLTQSCRETPETPHKMPFHIPIQFALFKTNGERILCDISLLELREEKQTFEFHHLTEKPLVSLLRDFSAPVILHRDTEDAELIKLLHIETDGFTKWDIAQDLAVKQIIQLYQTPEAHWQIPQTFIQTYQQLALDESLNMDLRAELLTLPSFEDVTRGLTQLNVQQIEKARDYVLATLGQNLFSTFNMLYQNLWQQEDHSLQSHAYGRRKLRNTCLRFLMKADAANTITLCQQQFTEAKTMTDQLASFTLLVNSQQRDAQAKAVAEFYQQWQSDDLVLDKWFTVQAMSESPGTLNVVRDLLKHPAFNIKNPNKVRALIGAFTQNFRHFHANDGRGYQFLSEMLVQVDKINPQISSRLATPFTRWQSLNTHLQKLIQQQLAELQSLKLSRNLSEVINKGLES